MGWRRRWRRRMTDRMSSPELESHLSGRGGAGSVTTHVWPWSGPPPPPPPLEKGSDHSSAFVLQTQA